jgi:hypothetical protein
MTRFRNKNQVETSQQEANKENLAQSRRGKPHPGDVETSGEITLDMMHENKVIKVGKVVGAELYPHAEDRSVNGRHGSLEPVVIDESDV